MSVWLLARYEAAERRFRLVHLLGGLTWFGALLATWRAAVSLALVEYAKLPSSPPGDCYVATAASQGHKSFVRSWERVGSSGEALGRANHQLVVLKAAELVLVATWPQLHDGLRRVYDRWGPLLAAEIRDPLTADLAYLSLKPAEWIARSILWILAPDFRRIATRRS